MCNDHLRFSFWANSGGMIWFVFQRSFCDRLLSTTHKVKMRGWTGSMVALGGLTLGSPMGLGGKDHPRVSWKTGSLFQVFRGGLGMPFLCIQSGSDQTCILIYTHIFILYIYIIYTIVHFIFLVETLASQNWRQGKSAGTSYIWGRIKYNRSSFNPLKSMISPYLWLKSS